MGSSVVGGDWEWVGDGDVGGGWGFWWGMMFESGYVGGRWIGEDGDAGGGWGCWWG